MAYTATYSAWHSWPVTDTPITAAYLQGVDDWVGTAANGTGGTNVFSGNSATGKVIQAAQGTDASPDAAAGPIIKAARTMKLSSGDFNGDGHERCCSILGINKSTTDNSGQVVGVVGLGITQSTLSATSGESDSCGIYGFGRAIGSSLGVGIGGAFAGQRETTTAKCTAIQGLSANYTASAAAYNSAQFPHCSALWLVAGGTSNSTAAIAVGNANNLEFDVGLAFTAVNGGPVTTATISDDGDATTSLRIGGTHTNAMTVGSTAGKVLIGATTETFSATKLEVIGSTSSDPLALFGSNGTHAFSIRLRNSTAASNWFIAAGASNFVTGTVAGDAGHTIPNNQSFVFGQSGSSKIVELKNNGGTSQIGWFTATPASKQTVTGSRGSNAALQSLLTALATYGLITDSSS